MVTGCLALCRVCKHLVNLCMLAFSRPFSWACCRSEPENRHAQWLSRSRARTLGRFGDATPCHLIASAAEGTQRQSQSLLRLQGCGLACKSLPSDPGLSSLAGSAESESNADRWRPMPGKNRQLSTQLALQSKPQIPSQGAFWLPCCFLRRLGATFNQIRHPGKQE